MTPFIWVCLLLASSSSLDLVDETYHIPANEWRYVELTLKQKPALIKASMEAHGGAGEVRVALLRRDALDRLREDRAHGVLAATAPGDSGQLQFYLRDPGDYAVVVDNREGDVPASVHLRVSLDFGWNPGPAVTLLSPRRQAIVVAISFAVFVGIVSWSARRLLKGMRKSS